MKFTEEEVEAMKYALGELDFYQDEGPDGEGWQGSKLVAGLNKLWEIVGEIEASNERA